MTLTIVHNDLGKVERGDAFEAGGVKSQLVRVRTAPVVRVYPAFRAEVVFGNACVETVRRELVVTLQQFEAVDAAGDCNGPAHPAD